MLLTTSGRKESEKSFDRRGSPRTDRFSQRPAMLAKRLATDASQQKIESGAHADNSDTFTRLPAVHTANNMFRQNIDGYQQANIGPRTDQVGRIVPYSIVGKAEWFVREDLRAKGLLREETEVVDTSLKARNRAVSLALKERLRSTSKHSRQPLEFVDQEEPVYIEEDVTKDQLVQQIEDVLDRVRTNGQEETRATRTLSKKIDPGELLYITKDSRTLEKFNQQQAQWQKIIQTTSARVRREFDNSIYLVSDNFRARRETQKALEIIEPDEKRYGDRFWMMTLRNYGKEIIQKQPSQKVIDDVPRSFNTFQPVRQDTQLEIVRKPVSSKLKSKYDGLPPFTTYKSGEYFKQRLQQSRLDAVRHLDDTGYELLEVQGTNKLAAEVGSLLQDEYKDAQTDKNGSPTTYKKKYHRAEYRVTGNEITRTEEFAECDEEEEIIDVNYDTKRLSKIGGLSLKTYNTSKTSVK